LRSRLQFGGFGWRSKRLGEEASSAERADEQSEISEQDDGKRERGKKRKLGASSIHHLYAEHRGDEAAGQKPYHELALVGREGAPSEAAELHGKPAGDKERSKTLQRQNGVLA